MAVIIAVPLGLITAIYLGEIAPLWQREILKPIIEMLAGIPSIVLGFLGWVLLAPLIQQTGRTHRTDRLHRCIDSGLHVAADHHQHLRGCALRRAQGISGRRVGHRRHQVADHPACCAAGGSLRHRHRRDAGVGRAIGETMAVMMVTGNAANIPGLRSGIFFQPVRTMTATIAAEMGEVAQGSLHYSTLFAIGIVLFLITFAINSLAGRLVGVEVSRQVPGGRSAMSRQADQPFGHTA